MARGVLDAWQETLILVALLLAALGLVRQLTITPGLVLGLPEELKGPDVSVWVAVLLIQSVPYAAALLMSLVSALSLPARWLGHSRHSRRSASEPSGDRTG